MEIIRSVYDMQKYAEGARCARRTIGFVPTMGYLHEGHLSLVRRARTETELVVVSIFINPTQFGSGEDLSSYPRDFDSDQFLLEKEKADVIFAPGVSQMYPEPSLTRIYVHKLGNVLCGEVRPGHFEGVALVVLKLLNIVKPHRIYFGAKDWQQQTVVRRMVGDLSVDVKIVTCPTVRDEDGLALSSRNSYLSQEERKRALVLYKSLKEAERLVKSGERNVDAILKRMTEMIAESNPDKIDYVSAVHPETLEPLERLEGPVLFAAAARFGRARLIDNIMVNPDSETG